MKKKVTIYLTDRRKFTAYFPRVYAKDEAGTLQPEQNSPANQETNSKTDRSAPIGNIGIAIGSLSGILLALFVFFGRVYAQGYFSALNIPFPAYRLELSLDDYAAGGWLPVSVIMIITFLGFVSIGGFWSFYIWVKKLFGNSNYRAVSAVRAIPPLGFVTLVGIFLLLPDLASVPSSIRIFIFIGSALIGMFWFVDKRITDYRPALGMISIGVMGLVAFVTIFLLLQDLMSSTLDQGENVSHNQLIKASIQVEVLSKSLLSSDLISAPCSKTPSSGDCFKYEDLYFLIYNGGHYFFFTDFGADCKPQKVYVVRDEELISVKMISDQIAPVPPKCQDQGQNVSTPTPSPTLPSVQQTDTPAASNTTATP